LLLAGPGKRARSSKRLMILSGCAGSEKSLQQSRLPRNDLGFPLVVDSRFRKPSVFKKANPRVTITMKEKNQGQILYTCHNAKEVLAKLIVLLLRIIP